MNLLDPQEPVVFIEFNNDLTPYQVFTNSGGGRHTVYDAHFSRREALILLDQSSHGEPYLQSRAAKWWAPHWYDVSGVEVWAKGGGVKLTGKPPPKKNRVPDAAVLELPGDFDPIKIADLSDRMWTVDGVVICAFCNDVFEDGGDDDEPCRHVKWCRPCGMWSTPDERCEHDKRKLYKPKG